MTKWTKTAGLIFMAAASVYADRAIAAKPVGPAKPQSKAPAPAATDVKVLDETDPFATPAPNAATAGSAKPSDKSSSTAVTAVAGAPTTAPTSQPAETAPAKGSAAAPMQLNADGTFSLNITAGADIV